MEIIKQSKKALNRAIMVLNKGGVVVCPTDTVYGFLALAENKEGVDRIFRIKKRSKKKPLLLFVKDLKSAKALSEIDKEQEKLIKKYWPGKTTFILNRKKGVKLYGVDKKTIGLRIPKYSFLNSLLKKADKPLVQTSVNISGGLPLRKIGEIIETFEGLKNKPDLIVDAGSLLKNKPSVIIDLVNNKQKILRK